jgi:hypothetical protein
MIVKPKFCYKKVQVFICIFLLSFSCNAQQFIDTVVDYNNYLEFPCSVYQVQDSGYIFVTSGVDLPANTYWTEFNKLNTDGSIAFQKVFGWPGYKLFVGSSGSLKPTFDGGWAFGGADAINASFNKSMLVKYNAAGDTEFVKISRDTAQSAFEDCIQTSDSGFALAGIHYHTSAAQSDIYIVKTDANGDTLWTRILGANFDEQAFYVIENSHHQIIVSGAKANSSGLHYPYVAVYDLQGNLINTISFNQGALFSGGGGFIWHYDENDYILSAALDTVINVGDYPYPQYVARLDSNFHFIWRTIYNEPVVKDVYIAQEISNGGIVLVGFTEDSAAGYIAVGWIAKMDSSGNKLWEHFYYHNINSDNYFSDFQETFDHGFIVCGTTINSVTNNQDSWIVKLDSNGCLDTNCGINTGTVEVSVSGGLEFTVFPNPAMQQVTITTFEEKGELILYDFLGKEILTKTIEHEKQITLDVSSLANGIYLLQFNTGKKVFTAKVIKE